MQDRAWRAYHMTQKSHAAACGQRICSLALRAELCAATTETPRPAHVWDAREKPVFNIMSINQLWGNLMLAYVNNYIFVLKFCISKKAQVFVHGPKLTSVSAGNTVAKFRINTNIMRFNRMVSANSAFCLKSFTSSGHTRSFSSSMNSGNCDEKWRKKKEKKKR